MKSSLHIQLLGTFQLTHQQQALPSFKNAPRLQSLLGYLVLHSGSVNGRSQLAHLFWPTSTPSQARTNLRKLLYQLRKALPDADHYLHQEKETLRWNPDANYILDVDQLQTIFAHIESEPFNHQLLQDAAAHYTGELLPTVYDNWVFPLRRDLQDKTVQILERLSRLRQNQAEYAQAIHYTEQALTIQPLAEKYYRWLMQLHAQNDDRLSAIHTYQRCTAMLQTQFSTTPSRETEAAYKQVMAYQPVTVAKQPTSIPFIGRQPEQQQLQAALTQSLKGEARFVCIAGDPGIGKTRLSEELLAWTQQQGIITARTRSYTMQGGLALAALAHLLREDALADRFAALPDTWLVQIARLIPELLDAHPDLALPDPVSEGWQRRQFYEALARAILVDDSPVVLFFDDLQWLDVETLEWLHYLIRFDPQAKLLIVGTFRDNEVDAHHPLEKLRINLHRDDLLTDIPLTPFNETDSLALATAVFHTTIAQSQQNSLYAHTQGNPLFIIETIRAQHGTQATGKSAAPLPAKMSAVIRSRLSMLSPEAYDLAKIAANIGGTFGQDLLAATSLLPAAKLTSLLDELGQQRIFTEHQLHQYDFSHDKIREVALDQTGPAQKRRLNLHIARAKESVYVERLDEIVGELAIHYELAGLLPEAIGYHQQAASVEQARGAYANGILHLEKGLLLIDQLPDKKAQIEQELTMQISLGFALVQIKGASDPIVETTFNKAYQLCQHLEKDPRFFQTIFGLTLFYMTRGNMKRLTALSHQCFELVQQSQDTVQLIISHVIVGISAYFSGHFHKANTHLAQVFDYYDPEQHAALAAHLGQDPGMAAYAYWGIALWFAGYPKQGREKMQAALQLAKEINHPYTIALNYFLWAKMSMISQDPKTAQTVSQALFDICEKHGISLLHLQGQIISSWAKGMIAVDNRQAIEELAQTAKTYVTMGSETAYPFALNHLAQLHLNNGDITQANAALEEAFTYTNKNGDRYFLSDTHRLKGVALQASHPQEAEQQMQQAIAIAQEQGTKTLELRATVSLCRLYQTQGKQTQALTLLSAIYNWFTEGFDTYDLQSAKALLDELA